MPEKAEVIFLRGGESRSDPAAVRHDPTQSASDPTVADLPVDKGRRNETRGSDASNAVTTALCEQAPRSIGISYTPFVRGILPFYKTFIQADQGEYHSGILPIRALEVTPGFEPGNEGFAAKKAFVLICFRGDKMTINKVTTVKEIMADWLEKSERPNLKPSSFDRKENSCKWQIYPYIGSIPAKKLDNNDVEDLIQILLAKGYSCSTIKKAIEAIGACYRYYRLHRKLTNTPTDGVRAPSGGRNRVRRIRFYSFEQLQMIQKECLRTFGNGVPVYPQGDLLVVLINTGMRVGELLALSWPDVDLCRRLITIDKNAVIVKERNEQKENHYKQIIQDSTKTSSGIRTIPMNNEAHAAFVRLAALYGKRGLIAKTRNGNPLLVGNVERTLKRVLQNLNFPEDGWYNVHALRHSFATALLSKGADIKKVSEILGHSSVQITYDYYIHFIPKDYADTVKLLDFS